MANTDELLSFKEFVPTGGNSESAQININSPKKNQYNFIENETSDFLSAGDLSDGPQRLKDGEEGGEKQPVYSLFSIEYYQQFFNVDTKMVVDRIMTSMIPKKAPGNYLKSHIGVNPDLYGPFWIVTTLIFSIAISGNIASYLQSGNEEDFKWRYNFHLVSYSATAIMFYASAVPFGLWAAFKWTIKPVDPDLETDTVRYSLS